MLISSRKALFFFASLIMVTFGLVSPKAHALVSVDMLGETIKPLLAPARDKVQGLFRFLWLQPYGGYALGSGPFTIYTVGATTRGVSKFEGPYYGGRGGLLLFRNVRLGVDYTRQLAKRSEAGGPSVGSAHSLWGAGIGFDIPYTPLQGFVSRTYSVKMSSGGDFSGTGWSGGISFLLVNPFIIMMEYRTFSTESAVQPNGDRTTRNAAQAYLGLSMNLF